ncbi:hypothetical protein BB8028_0005g02300 [Beauveria bassiana]|uniref:Uncharacterized protein n=1 Tax=Beauveria bassiana TaxID=176275 RepID=A0A2S7YES9_BEABA|nr:hypothetical protein BB8028_0005g02300 [Beauveria bassiana]
MHVLDRLRLATNFFYNHADDLRYLLWIDGKVQREDVRTLDEIGLPLMKIISSNYALHLQLLNNSRSTESWRQLSREIAGLTTLLHSTEKPSQVTMEALEAWYVPIGTALFTILRNQTVVDAWRIPSSRGFSQWRRVFERILQNWLEDLQRGGIDLEKYGQVEEEIFRQMNWFESKVFRQPKRWYSCGPTTYALIGFNYGPEPEDWRFEWELDTDELVGEFWELIDNQDIRIVGSWVDDD